VSPVALELVGVLRRGQGIDIEQRHRSADQRREQSRLYLVCLSIERDAVIGYRSNAFYSHS